MHWKKYGLRIKKTEYMFYKYVSDAENARTEYLKKVPILRV